MPVSPQDFQLWASLTGNKYPSNVHERAALAPEVYTFTRNLGRKGGVRDITRVSYDRAEALDHPNRDSLIQAPVTPDNSIPKVAGTHDGSLTSQHYENEQADHVAEQSRFRRAVDIAGKTALVAGGIAGGVALARNPTVQRAAQQAAGAINTHIGDVKTRVSDFLGGIMGSERTPGTQVVDASGDVTPPTTAEHYQQKAVPSQMLLLQAASGAPPQVDLKDAVSSGFNTNAPAIATSQSFTPEPSAALDVETTAAGNANLYKGYTKGVYESPRISREVAAARKAAGVGTRAMAPTYKNRFTEPTKEWVRQTQSPADLGYTHTADPFTGEYTFRSNEPWTGEASVADRAQSFLTELQQTKTTQLPTTQALLPPGASLSDVTATGPVAMPSYEKDVNFDQQTSDIGVTQSTPISNYDPVNTTSIQERLAPYYKGGLQYGEKSRTPSTLVASLGSGQIFYPETKYIHQDLRKALNLSATTGDYGIAEGVLKGQRFKDLSTTAYAGMSPAGTNVLENIPTSQFLTDISNMKKLPYEVGVTGGEGSIPLSVEQKALRTGELGISHPSLNKAGEEIKFLRGEEINALNRKSAADSALQSAIEVKRSQLRDPREIAAFETDPHSHPSIAPYAEELRRAALKHKNAVNQLEGSLVPYQSIRGNELQMRSGGKVARTEENLANLGLMRSGKEGPRGFTFLSHPSFETEQNPLGIYGAEPRQAYKSLYTPELYQTAAETPTNIGFKGLGRGAISPEQVMVTASGKGYRAGTEEGVNPASIADPTIAAEQPWLKTPEGLTYVQRALTSSAEFTPRKERKAALSLLERTHELNEQAKALRVKGDLEGASNLLMASVRLKKEAQEKQAKPSRRGTPEQGAKIALQMQLERDIKAGSGPKVSLPVTNWSQVSRGQATGSSQLAQRVEQAAAEEQAYQKLQQDRARAIAGGQSVMPSLRSGERLTQKESDYPGRYASSLTPQEQELTTVQRRISGYETPHYPMSEPYNPHIGTRVTQLPADVLGQTLGPGVTPPSRPSDLEQYRAQSVPARQQTRQLVIPGTQEAASTPTQADTLRQQLAAYMARRAQQLPGRFAYQEPTNQLNLKLF